MQLLIVDDEAHWVDNLAMNKPWHTLGITGVHKAYSAREALELIDANGIDIVISDILMPEMTGIELIQKIRERDKGIKCIILSGHSDFEYAKEAVRHQAVEYVLKPPSDEELFAAVGTARDQLQAEWASVSSFERTQFTLRENLPLLRGQLLLGALRGERLRREEWSRKLESYGLPVEFGDSWLMLVRMEEEFGQYRNKGQHLLEYAVMNIAEEIVGEYAQVWGVKDEHGYLVFLLQRKGEATRSRGDKLLEGLMVRLQSKVKQYLQGSLSIVMTETFQFPEDLAARYRRSVSSFRQIVGDEREFIMVLGEEDKSPSHGTLESIHMPPLLGHLLEAGRWDAAEEKLGDILGELDGHYSDSLEHCMEAGFLIAAAFTHIAHRNGLALSGLPGVNAEQLMNGEAFSSISRLRVWSIGALSALRSATANEMNDTRSRYVKKVQQFAERNLHLDVSLRALADHVNLHTTHLSKIYKLETGEGISDYVSRLRMERACHLLRASDKKVYEISAEIGYLEPAYFIKVFKKQFGVTPQEYRNGQQTT
ncbi:response regulator [Paenibacillus sp. CAU 1782]